MPTTSLFSELIPAIVQAGQLGFSIDCARIVVSYETGRYRAGNDDMVPDPKLFILKRNASNEDDAAFFDDCRKQFVSMSSSYAPLTGFVPAMESTVWLKSDRGEAAWISISYSEYDSSESLRFVLNRQPIVPEDCL